ncbi:6-phosphogluconolactonase [Metapseudomonas resinovorans]|uniref:6-phosphogluconolactonase n=1 Tax=Metapseudomonas resinovorans NBRC 106553 TaxID=1245471 RepID=S6AGK1_METRE|nr:6-phosphogluconolactonase [Pseudomonas resinovorans]BAN47195.1 6-phosphogluconolactonase [Pseudomonas resinovorans NBRC 106553]
MAICNLDLPTQVTGLSLGSPEQLAGELAITVANALRDAIDSHGSAVLVVSGGRSPVAFFERLRGQELDWSKVTVSLADERFVPVGHPDSNEGLVRRHLLQGPAAKARLLGLYHAAPSLEEAARLADAALAELGRIDVLVLGMGEDGHTASLFPASPNLELALSPGCRQRCLPMQAPGVPRQRLSLTLPLLASAHLTLLALQGQAKLATLEDALAGDDVAAMPIRAFLRRPLEIHWCP